MCLSDASKVETRFIASYFRNQRQEISFEKHRCLPSLGKHQTSETSRLREKISESFKTSTLLILRKARLANVLSFFSDSGQALPRIGFLR
jgi:hypothetical protein